MAISEKTKIAVANLRAQREAQLSHIDRQIAEHEATIISLKAQRKSVKEEFDALKKDIAAPKPVEE